MMDPSCCIVLYFVKVVCILCVCGSQMDDAYSRGLTIVLYACDFTVVEACLRFLFRMFSVFYALLVVFCMCVVHLRSDCSSICQDMGGA